jgi:4-oxalocrotonate tautomerase
MPYVTITASPTFSAEQKKSLLQGASDAIERSIKAPLTSIRVWLEDLPDGYYLNAGKFDTQALMYSVELIEGRSEELKSSLIAELSKSGAQATGLSEDEIRVRLLDYPKGNMGMAGGISALQGGR